MWEFQDVYCLEEEASLGILDGASPNDDPSKSITDEATPLKSCGDLAHYVAGNENPCKVSGKQRELSSQLKRRRMLQFESEVPSVPLLGEEDISTFLGLERMGNSIEEAIPDASKWESGFSDNFLISGNDGLDASAEGWLVDCFNDGEMYISQEDVNMSGTSDIQTDISDIGNSTTQLETGAVRQHPVRTRPNVVFKGRKSYMKAPSKVPTSVVYPFAFVKPCGVHGDVTLEDINQRILNPQSKAAQKCEDPSISYPTSAFSGKPVVGKTKIRTEGGKGSITIMRTKG